jgi:formylglycine-generating enzyme required for sulfatase activity
MGTNPSHFSAGGRGKRKVRGLDTCAFPVESVSWEDAAAFLDRLSALPEERKEGRTYRLPSEAEWEHACRGGASSQIFHFGNSLSSLQANFNGKFPYGSAGKGPALERPCPVGSYAANPFGLFDMHGNVWEWCNDRYGERHYRGSPRRDPQGPSKGVIRVIRGGSWDYLGQNCRSAARTGAWPSNRIRRVGFRVALVASVK